MIKSLHNSTKKAKNSSLILGGNHQDFNDLKFKKIATGVTYDVFQWVRPKDSNNLYKVILNGEEFEKSTDAERILETINVSNFKEGKNTIRLIAYTIDNKKFSEQLDVYYSAS